MVEIDEFKKVGEDKTLTFKEIWNTYDKQFEMIRMFLQSLGDRIIVETFTESTDRVLHLKHHYAAGTLTLLYNGVLQIKDKDYVESTFDTVTLVEDREYDDEITVLIINTVLGGSAASPSQ